MADAHGYHEQYVEKYFTVHRPSDPHERLHRPCADVKGEEEEAFQEIDGIRPGLLEHAREEQQEQEGARCHQVVQGEDTDQPFSQEMPASAVGGEHDHEAADAEKDVHAESAAVQEADVLQHDEERRDAPQRLDAVKMCLMKIR